MQPIIKDRIEVLYRKIATCKVRKSNEIAKISMTNARPEGIDTRGLYTLEKGEITEAHTIQRQQKLQAIIIFTAGGSTDRDGNASRTEVRRI